MTNKMTRGGKSRSAGKWNGASAVAASTARRPALCHWVMMMPMTILKMIHCLYRKNGANQSARAAAIHENDARRRVAVGAGSRQSSVDEQRRTAAQEEEQNFNEPSPTSVWAKAFECCHGIPSHLENWCGATRGQNFRPLPSSQQQHEFCYGRVPHTCLSILRVALTWRPRPRPRRRKSKRRLLKRRAVAGTRVRWSVARWSLH